MYVSGNLPTDSSVDGKDTESKRKKTKKKTNVGREKGLLWYLSIAILSFLSLKDDDW